MDTMFDIELTIHPTLFALQVGQEHTYEVDPVNHPQVLFFVKNLRKVFRREFRTKVIGNKIYIKRFPDTLPPRNVMSELKELEPGESAEFLDVERFAYIRTAASSLGQLTCETIAGKRLIVRRKPE